MTIVAVKYIDGSNANESVEVIQQSKQIGKYLVSLMCTLYNGTAIIISIHDLSLPSSYPVIIVEQIKEALNLISDEAYIEALTADDYLLPERNLKLIFHHVDKARFLYSETFKGFINELNKIEIPKSFNYYDK